MNYCFPNGQQERVDDEPERLRRVFPGRRDMLRRHDRPAERRPPGTSIPGVPLPAIMTGVAMTLQFFDVTDLRIVDILPWPGKAHEKSREQKQARDCPGRRN